MWVCTGARKWPAYYYDERPPDLRGYPKLGTINPFDLGRLAQCQPGQTVRFTRIEGKVAQQQLRRFYQFLMFA